jgi:hypothetical protein
VQGYELDDYLRCRDLYARMGVDLTAEARVGLGSVCRRSATTEIARIAAALADEGLRLHGFGVKTRGLGMYAHDLVSADSLGWSYRGRHVAGCADSHKTEANCLRFATSWRDRVLARIPAAYQPRLFAGLEDLPAEEFPMPIRPRPLTTGKE